MSDLRILLGRRKWFVEWLWKIISCGIFKESLYFARSHRLWHSGMVNKVVSWIIGPWSISLRVIVTHSNEVEGFAEFLWYRDRIGIGLTQKHKIMKYIFSSFHKDWLKIILLKHHAIYSQRTDFHVLDGNDKNFEIQVQYSNGVLFGILVILENLLMSMFNWWLVSY